MAGRRLSADEAALWARVMASVRPIAETRRLDGKVPGVEPNHVTANAGIQSGRRIARDLGLLLAQEHRGVGKRKTAVTSMPLDPIALELLRHAGLLPASTVPQAPADARHTKSHSESGVTKPESTTASNSAGSRKPKPQSANTLDASWDRQLARGLAAPDRTVDLHGHTLASAHTLLDTALDAAIRAHERVVLLVTGKPPRPASERPHARGAIRAAVGDWLAGSRHAASIAAVRGAHPRHGGAGALYIVLRRPRVRQKP